MRDVILKACIPEQKLLTVKVIKEALGLGLKEAKELVDAIPSKIALKVTNEKAESLREQFEKEGMKIIVKDSLTGYVISPSNTTKIIKHDNDNQTKDISEETPNYWIMGTPNGEIS